MITDEQRQQAIIRQVCVKAAVDYFKSREGNIGQNTIIQTAQIYENWIIRVDKKEAIDIKLDKFNGEDK